MVMVDVIMLNPIMMLMLFFLIRKSYTVYKHLFVEIKSLELETVFVNLGLEENVLFDHELLELGDRKSVV